MNLSHEPEFFARAAPWRYVHMRPIDRAHLVSALPTIISEFRLARDASGIFGKLL